MKFSEILNGTIFMFKGHKYRKNSKCSAQLIEKNITMYFVQNEVIPVVLSEVN